MSLALRKPIAHYDIAQISREEVASARGEIHDYDDGLLAIAGPVMVLCYGLLFAIAAVTFFGAGSALFAVVISAGFALVFFAVPALMLRTRAARDRRWRRDAIHATNPVVDVWTGPMHRWEAVVQIISIPIAILLGFTLLAIRWSVL